MIQKTTIFDNRTMIFDTKIKAGAQTPAHQTTNTYYIMKDTKRKRSMLYVAAIENFLTILGIAGDSLCVVELAKEIDHRA